MSTWRGTTRRRACASPAAWSPGRTSRREDDNNVRVRRRLGALRTPPARQCCRFERIAWHTSCYATRDDDEFSSVVSRIGRNADLGCVRVFHTNRRKRNWWNRRQRDRRHRGNLNRRNRRWRHGVCWRLPSGNERSAEHLGGATTKLRLDLRCTERDRWRDCGCRSDYRRRGVRTLSLASRTIWNRRRPAWVELPWQCCAPLWGERAHRHLRRRW
jgi:hypothetical protein